MDKKSWIVVLGLLIIITVAGLIIDRHSKELKLAREAEQAEFARQLALAKQEIQDYLEDAIKSGYPDLQKGLNFNEALKDFTENVNLLESGYRQFEKIDTEIQELKTKIERDRYTVVGNLQIGYFHSPTIAVSPNGHLIHFVSPPSYPEGAQNFRTQEYYTRRPFIKDNGELDFNRSLAMPILVPGNAGAEDALALVREELQKNNSDLESLQQTKAEWAAALRTADESKPKVHNILGYCNDYQRMERNLNDKLQSLGESDPDYFSAIHSRAQVHLMDSKDELDDVVGNALEQAGLPPRHLVSSASKQAKRFLKYLDSSARFFSEDLPAASDRPPRRADGNRRPIRGL